MVDYIKRIRSLKNLIKLPSDAILLSKIKKQHPADIAEIISSFHEEKQLRLLSSMSFEKAAEILTEMNSEARTKILVLMPVKKLAHMIDFLDSDDATDLFQNLPSNKRKLLLPFLSTEQKANIKSLAGFFEDSAGGLMRREALLVFSSDTVKTAFRKIKRKVKAQGEEFNTIYVVDENKKLVGVLPIVRLLLVEENKRIEEIMNKKVITVNADLDQEEVIKAFKKYDFVSLPVVDSNDRFLGIITVDDVIDVIEEEDTEDLLRFSGLKGNENVFDSWHSSVKKRFPWLALNLLTAFLAAFVVSMFQKTLEAYIILAVFMPVIAGMGGNAGTQTLAVIVRSIALGEISKENSLRILFKELTAAFVNGLFLGLIVSLITFYFNYPWFLGLILLFSMTVNIFVAALAGTVIPLTLKKLDFDPALASSIFLTTFTDVIGFFSFLGTATILLNYLL